jgi:hypothetical protein
VAVSKDALVELTKSQTMWDRILLTTPIALTIIATLLAAMSNSESNSAQYSRSMAAQFQSKAGDQWGYFQAKKIRGSGMETTLDLLGQNGPEEMADAAAIRQTFDRISGDLDQIGQSATHLADTAVLGGLDPAGHRGEIQHAAQQLSQTAAHLQPEAARIKTELDKALAEKECVAAMGFMAAPHVPEVVDKPLDSPEVKSAIDAIAAGQDDGQTVPLVVKIDAGSLHDAYSVVDENSREFEAAIKPIARGLDRLEPIIGGESILEHRIDRSVSDLGSTIHRIFMDAVSIEQVDGDWFVLKDASSNAQTDAADLYRQFTAARLKFQALRYAREADYNMTIAQLYEIQVRQYGAESDRHRVRSKHFFYGMLAAQAGVTIATFGLALRRKSVLWGLATAAGLGAVLFSAYVYLFI